MDRMICVLILGCLSLSAIATEPEEVKRFEQFKHALDRITIGPFEYRDIALDEVLHRLYLASNKALTQNGMATMGHMSKITSNAVFPIITIPMNSIYGAFSEFASQVGARVEYEEGNIIFIQTNEVVQVDVGTAFIGWSPIMMRALDENVDWERDLKELKSPNIAFVNERAIDVFRGLHRIVKETGGDKYEYFGIMAVGVDLHQRVTFRSSGLSMNEVFDSFASMTKLKSKYVREGIQIKGGIYGSSIRENSPKN